MSPDYKNVRNQKKNHESEDDFDGLLVLLVRMAGYDGANRISEAGVPRSVDTVCEWTISGNASPADAGDACQPIR